LQADNCTQSARKENINLQRAAETTAHVPPTVHPPSLVIHPWTVPFVNRTAILPVPENGDGTAEATTVVVAIVVDATAVVFVAVDATAVVFVTAVVDLAAASARLPKARRTSEQRISILSAAKVKCAKLRFAVEQDGLLNGKSRVICFLIMVLNVDRSADPGCTVSIRTSSDWH